MQRNCNLKKKYNTFSDGETYHQGETILRDKFNCKTMKILKRRHIRDIHFGFTELMNMIGSLGTICTGNVKKQFFFCLIEFFEAAIP